MAAGARSRPSVVDIDIHDDHSHKELPLGTATSALGELPLNNIHNIKHRSSIESLAHRLDNFHLYSSDKENKSRRTREAASRVPSAALSAKDILCGITHENHGATVVSPVSEEVDENNPLAVASRRLPSTKEQLAKHQEGQFEWLLSIPVKTTAAGRRPHGDSHDDAELRHGEKTLYFGCNLVRRRTQSGGALDGKPTDVYTLLATRIKGEDEFTMATDAELAHLHDAAAGLSLSDAPMHEPYKGSDVPKSSEPIMEVREVSADSDGEGSRPLSRIEDSVEAIDKLEEEIEALAQVAQLERVLSPEAAARTNGAGGKTTPMKRATSVRASATPTRSKTVERASSVRRPTTSTGDDEKTASGSAASPARKVPRPASLLPPKPLAKSSKPPTMPTFELPGEAVARRLKEQREQRRSQQISSEQAAALAEHYSPSKPHFKSSKPPTRPTFELPGEAISRKKREEREAKLRAQEEEERKRREFKARPIRASLAPSTVPRETLTSLARKSRATTTEGSSDSATTTVTPGSAKKHQSVVLPSSTTTTPTTTSATLPSRGRNPDPSSTASTAGNSRAHSTTPSQASIHSRSSVRSKQTSGTAATDDSTSQQQKSLRGKEVYARDNAAREERERERRERENAARLAREKAAERSREMSRLWAEKKRLKKVVEARMERVRELELEAVGLQGRREG